MRVSIVPLSVALIALAAHDASALDPARRVSQYSHRHLAARDGLPHGLANSIAQTPDGYLWIGTEQGLARFDGQQFTNFDRSNGLRANSLAALAADPGGGLWVGTRERGLQHMSGGAFQSVAEDSALGLQVRALLVDRSGDLWVGTRDRGVAHLHAGAVASALRVADGLPSDDVRALTITRGGAMWIATFAGPVQLVGTKISPGPRELAGVLVNAIAEDRRGDVWFGTANGLARLHAGTLAFVDLGWPQATVVQLLCDRDGNLWIGLSNGLAQRTENGRVEVLGTTDAQTLALFEDREGNVWFGAENGLGRLSAGDVVPLGAVEGLTDHSVFGVLEDTAGTMWFATAVGLFRWPRGERTATNVAPEHGMLYAVYEDGRGDVWTGARDGSVGRWHDDSFTWLWTGTWEKVRSIVGVYGALWLGTDHGLYRQRGDRLDQIEPVLPGPIVSAITVDPGGGSLWLGTEGSGLLRVTTSGSPAPVPPGGPPAWSSVTTLSFDPDGTLWAGTEGDGLWRLSAGRWAVVTAKDGMFDDLVWRVLDDGHGALWMSSNRGIWQVRRDQLVARAAGGKAPVVSIVYGEADGMRDRECNGAISPAGWRTRDGRLWFPTGAGVAIVDPAHLHVLDAPLTLVESARVDGQERPLAAGLLLAPGASRFELRYTAPVMRSPERVRYRFRLEGVDAGWNEAGTQKLAQYTNLSPGHYRFVVQASLGGGWGEPGWFGVTLEPRLYQTAWFYAIASLAAVLAILAIPFVRMRQARARERELAQRVHEALREVKVLSGMLPICAWCKKVRDDGGYWRKIEAYLGTHTDAKFSHGICPECVEKLDAESDTAAP